MVRDDAILNKFHNDNAIPKDVQIERPWPNENVNLVEDNRDRIPIRTRLIYKVVLRFPIRLMLKKVMAHYHLLFMQVSVNFLRTVIAVDTLMRQMKKLPFNAEDLLNIYTVVRPMRELSTSFLKGNY